MTNPEQDRWSRVKGRLRSSVGDDVYSSWFARMDLENVQRESVRLSVPTTFLKSWIQSHYADRVLSCCQAEMPEVGQGLGIEQVGAGNVDSWRCHGRTSVPASPDRARRTAFRKIA